MDISEDIKNDHDLLIRIDTRLGLLMTQFNDHKQDAMARLAILEETKMGREEHRSIQENSDKIEVDHETRIRRIELYGSIAIGALLVVQAIFGIKII